MDKYLPQGNTKATGMTGANHANSVNHICQLESSGINTKPLNICFSGYTYTSTIFGILTSYYSVDANEILSYYA